jgi:hypothetical protein
MPGNEDEAGVSELLWYYANYKGGRLPEAGGLLDQSGHMMTMFRVIDGAISTVEHHQQEELEKERRKNATDERNPRGGARLTPKRPAR